ncbi:hypothetical protein K0M31_003025 [Melipona bicolor]|uniref:Uncharacterized protein n=1 Tax=Melipona bicolor TaxID=60889 RepID=A0AA40G084_9HYME|nr:hypothetical protein K0M31_003025 [Melipona bicolor]
MYTGAASNFTTGISRPHGVAAEPDGMIDFASRERVPGVFVASSQYYHPPVVSVRSVHRARPRVFIDLGKPPPDPPNIFPAESQEEICRANFTVIGFDRHGVPTVISRRETLMAATPSRLTSNDNLAEDPSSPSPTGCTASLFYRIFTESPRVHRMTPRQPTPLLSPSSSGNDITFSTDEHRPSVAAAPATETAR